jgi:predicted nuclease with TOPRIM domain
MQELNLLYDKEEKIQDTVAKLYKIYEQVKEDIELLELFIMHKYNRESRNKENGIV